MLIYMICIYLLTNIYHNKYKLEIFLVIFAVAPYAGAWIEINDVVAFCIAFAVAPYAGAWIEIKLYPIPFTIFSVAPYAGAWIEIYHPKNNTTN